MIQFTRAIFILSLTVFLILPIQMTAEDNTTNPQSEGIPMYKKPDIEEIKQKLTPLQFHVTQEAGTERPFTHEYYTLNEPGIYVDIVTGEPLFSSNDKYHSSCGWPAFSGAINDEVIVEKEDLSFGRRRTEVRSRSGDSHLGHVFQNDPESPNGTRYCINGASLRFVPKHRMEEEGYGYLLGELE